MRSVGIILGLFLSYIASGATDDTTSCLAGLTPDFFADVPGPGRNAWFKWDWLAAADGTKSLRVTEAPPRRRRGQQPSQSRRLEHISSPSPGYAFERLYRVRSDGWMELRKREARLLRPHMVVQLGLVLRSIDSVYFPEVLETSLPFDPPAIRLQLDGSETLFDYMNNPKSGGPHTDWFVYIARELLRLREEGILPFHGNLKPENIVINGENITLLFPAFRFTERSGSTVIATSPHFNPWLAADGRADVIAIGTILYEVLTGRTQFSKVPIARTGTVEEAQRRDRFESIQSVYERRNFPFTPDLRTLAAIAEACIGDPTMTLERFISEMTSYLKAYAD